MNIIGSFLIIVLGLCGVMFRKKIAKDASKWYYGDPYFFKRGHEIISTISGIVFIIFGVLSLIGIIKFK